MLQPAGGEGDKSDRSVARAEIQNTQEIERTLFNWTKQGKTCRFSRKSSFSSYVQHKKRKIDTQHHMFCSPCIFCAERSHVLTKYHVEGSMSSPLIFRASFTQQKESTVQSNVSLSNRVLHYWHARNHVLLWRHTQNGADVRKGKKFQPWHFPHSFLLVCCALGRSSLSSSQTKWGFCTTY